MIREIMDNCENLEDAGYGVEVAISRYVKRHNLPQKRVGLLDVSHVIKEEKLGFVQGSAQRLRMYWEIMRSSLRAIATGDKELHCTGVRW